MRGVSVGAVALRGPVVCASGTAGHGAELAAFGDLGALGAVVVKSLAPYPWAGNPPPRLHALPLGMLNSVGLEGPGVEAWIEDDLPALERAGAAVVASIWGRSVSDYAEAADALARLGPRITAVEVNLSCPNVGHGDKRSVMFAHDPHLVGEVMRATGPLSVPRWAKLSPNTDRLIEVAEAAVDAGAAALTLVNTLLGMVIDLATGRPVLGAGGGGVSGMGMHPVAVRCVHDVHRAMPHVPIVGVGGVANGEDAIELMMAGASAVQVGTATFADPRTPWRVQEQMEAWASREGLNAWGEIVGIATRDGRRR